MEQGSRDSKLTYKKSALQTEGNQLKKRAMHVKLSSLTSEVKGPFNIESEQQQNLDALHHSYYESDMNAMTPQPT